MYKCVWGRAYACVCSRLCVCGGGGVGVGVSELKKIYQVISRHLFSIILYQI